MNNSILKVPPEAKGGNLWLRSEARHFTMCHQGKVGDVQQRKVSFSRDATVVIGP
jgi:hypothetical protein